MRKMTRILIAAALGTFVLTMMVSAQETEKKVQGTRIGVKKCKMCHSKAKTGAQYKVWASSAHAKAYETLATPKAAEFAKARGIEGSPQKSDKCLKCHITAFGMTEKEMSKSKITLEEGVSCESCHGGGSLYYKKKTMSGLYKGTIKPEDVGLVMPNKDLCVTCHNEESPSYKEFDFDTFFAKIAHPIPEAKK